MLKVRIDEYTHELQTLAGCPGFHPGNGQSCPPQCVACYEGSWGDPDLSTTNGLLAHFSLLAGSRQVRGLAGSSYLPGGHASVRLYVNDAMFITDVAGEPSPVWAVIVKEHTEESHGVAVYTTLEAGEAAYCRAVDELYGETDCAYGMDHGLGETCDCAGVPGGRLDLRALIPRGQHCLASTYPSRCMCGAKIRILGLSGEHPTMSEHLDWVVDEALRDCDLQPQAAPALARLASRWRGSLAELVASANDCAAGA